MKISSIVGNWSAVTAFAGDLAPAQTLASDYVK
jgi:hypothetical protein